MVAGADEQSGSNEFYFQILTGEEYVYRGVRFRILRDDQVVVVLGQMFRQLVAGEVVAGDDAGHRTDLFENRQVAIDAGLGKGDGRPPFRPPGP